MQQYCKLQWLASLFGSPLPLLSPPSYKFLISKLCAKGAPMQACSQARLCMFKDTHNPAIPAPSQDFTDSSKSLGLRRSESPVRLEEGNSCAADGIVLDRWGKHFERSLYSLVCD